MPFGDTAKKVQKVTQTAEKLYERVNYLVEQLQELRDRVETTADDIESMDRELAEQRAIVEALAEQQGVDVEGVLAHADLPEVESEGGESGGGDAAADSGTAADGTDTAADSTDETNATDDTHGNTS